MSAPSNTGRAARRLTACALITLLGAVFAIGVGYGVILPFLPSLLEHLGQPTSDGAIQRTTGLLTGAYTVGPALLAPLWGALSDRVGRRPVLLVGLAGFSVTLVLSAAASSLAWLSAARVLNGACAAGVMPVILAIIADQAPNDVWRARRFSWVGVASIGGLLAGPTIGGLSATLISTTSPIGLAAPLLIAAALATLMTASAAMFVGEDERKAPHAGASRSATKPLRWRSNGLLVLTAANAVAIGSFEVGLALEGRELFMSPRALSLVFAECNLVMLVAQLVVFSRWVPLDWTLRMIVPTLSLLAVSLILLSGVAGRPPLRWPVDLFAVSTGILTPVLLFWISRTATDAQGAQLGRQTAALSLGQTLGSVGSGLFLASPRWSGSFFVVVAMLLVLACLAAFPIARSLEAPDEVGPTGGL